MLVDIILQQDRQLLERLGTESELIVEELPVIVQPFKKVLDRHFLQCAKGHRAFKANRQIGFAKGVRQ